MTHILSHLPEANNPDEVSRREEELFIRRRKVLELQMSWPPKTNAEMARTLGVPVHTVTNDILAIRKQLTSTQFANDHASRVGRAVAELEVIAQRIFTDIEAQPQLEAGARSSLYGQLLKAYTARNNLLMDAGDIRRAPTKVEATTNLTVDVTVGTVEDRLRQLLAQRGVESLSEPTRRVIDVTPAQENFEDLI